MKKQIGFVVLLLILSFIQVNAQDFAGIKQINGTGMYCKVIGKGEPMIIVHGGPGMAHNYLLKPFSQLADNNKLIFYDQRGNGLSDEFKKGEKVTVDDLVEDLECLRKEFGIEKMQLVGQSWGAIIAINYSAKYPQNVKKLFLLEPAPGSSEYLPEFVKRISERLNQTEKEERAALTNNPSIRIDPVLYKKLSNLQFKAYYFDTKRQDLNKMDYMDSARVKKMFASSAMFGSYIGNFNLYEKMKSITSPTLIIHGDYDVIPTESIEKMKLSIPQAEMHIIKECGHFVHVEKEKEYFDLIRAFLNKK